MVSVLVPVSKLFQFFNSIGFCIEIFLYGNKYRIWYQKKLVSKKVSDAVLKKIGYRKSIGIGIKNIWYRKKIWIWFCLDFGYCHTLCSSRVYLEYSTPTMSQQQLIKPSFPLRFIYLLNSLWHTFKKKKLSIIFLHSIRKILHLSTVLDACEKYEVSSLEMIKKHEDKLFRGVCDHDRYWGKLLNND